MLENYIHISERMNNIIQKATMKNSEDRYDSCKVLLSIRLKRIFTVWRGKMLQCLKMSM